jgi:hypothetical protein
MGHAILSHHVKKTKFLQLRCHPSTIALEKGSPINIKINEFRTCLLFNQTPLLHEGLNNHNNMMIYISTFNMLVWVK